MRTQLRFGQVDDSKTALSDPGTLCAVNARVRDRGQATLAVPGLQSVTEGVRVVSSARFFLSNVRIDEGSFIGHELRAYGGPSSELIVGRSCDIGPHVLVLAGSHEIGSAERRAGAGSGSTVQIGDGVWVGGAVTIVGPCHIGDGAVVAAGTVVRGDVPPSVVYFGRRAEDQRPITDTTTPEVADSV